ncbi:DnaB-like helicase C-terminal domain-containing protein [Actinoalloteichus caeruleus]|uniref:DnaB-like helicase C-terminal domain-containing protein n=1 Tax=Actinoalloteichus cyanogriseus TaxID=2893586 RepID=UPI003AAE986C
MGNADDAGEEYAHWEFAAVLQSTVDEVDAIASRGGSGYHIPTGFHALDDLTGGLRRGSLTVVGAHPGVGSSTLASDFIRGAAVRHGVASAYLTLDDTAEAVTQRLLCAVNKIRLADMRTGRMTDKGWTRLAKGVSAIHEKLVVITRLGDPDIAAVEDAVASLTAAQDTQLVIVDSLHMVTARRDVLYENREREVAEVTRRLKRLALDHNIAVVATVQLSCNSGPRQPVMPAPSLADLRDSGTIAHVADNVLLIHRPDAWDRDDPRAGEADLILAKHRHGPTATFLLVQQFLYGRFITLAI